jgi:hypothetical protein
MTTMASANCTPPPHPTEDVRAYVATATPDGPMLCGGYPYTSDCHILTKSGTWNRTAPMMTKRGGAASITFGGGWWVTGKLIVFIFITFIVKLSILQALTSLTPG